MKQELCTLSFQEKMLRQEMEMSDVVISQTASTTTDNESPQKHIRKEQFEIEQQQGGEMEDLNWQLELEKEFEEEGEEQQQHQQQQQQPNYEHEHEHEHEHASIIRKELTQATYGGGDGCRYNTTEEEEEEEEAELDTNMNTKSTQQHGRCASSLSAVCYDGTFGVEIMLVVPKNHSRPEIDVDIVVPIQDDDMKQDVVAHDKEQQIRGGESSRERAYSIHSDDPTLDTTSSNPEPTMSALESDSNALAMLKHQIREFDAILHDVLDVNVSTTMTSSKSQNYEYDDDLKQELRTLSFQEKMLKQEMDMIDAVVSQTTSTTTDDDNDEESQPIWNGQFEIKQQQDGEMQNSNWQLELEKEFEEEEQQQQPDYEHEHATIIRKELTQETYEGVGGYRYKAGLDTNMNKSTRQHGWGAPSLCEVSYDGIFGVEIMLVLVPKNHSQFLAIPARPEFAVTIVVPIQVDETRQEEEPVRNGESSRERADSFHSDDNPTLDATCSKSEDPVNDEVQDQRMEDESGAPRVRLGVLRSESEDTEENDKTAFQRYSHFLPSLDHVISDLSDISASDTNDPEDPLSVVCSEAAYMNLFSAFIPITPDRTIEVIHSQLNGGSLSKELLSNSQSQYTDDGKDGSIITDYDKDESTIMLQIFRSDDNDNSIIASEICSSESGDGGDGSQSMRMKVLLTIGASSETSRSQSMDEMEYGHLATSIGRAAVRSIQEQQRSIMDHKHSQSFDMVCRSQSLDESDPYQICEDEESKDTTIITTDSIFTIAIGIGDDGKEQGDDTVLSCSLSAENQSSFASSIIQSVVDPNEERREQEETSRFAYNICACVSNTMSNEKIDTVRPSGGNNNNNNNNNNIKSKKRMETAQKNPTTAEACISLNNPMIWESCIEETVNSKIRSHGSNKPPKEVDATSTPENVSINLSLEKEAMKLINLAIDGLAIDDNAIGLDEIGETYTEESQTEASALDHAMKAVESPIEKPSETSSLDKLNTDLPYLPCPTKSPKEAYATSSIDKGRAPEWKYLTTTKAGHRISALEYELQFSDSLLGSSSQLGTFDASEQVSDPSPSSAGTFDASDNLSVLLAATQPLGGRIEEARRGRPASLTALEYEMQISEDDMQLCSPIDEANFTMDSYDEDPEELTYRQFVLEARTGSIWDLASQEEVESNESYVFSEAPLETPTSEDSVNIPMIVRRKPDPKIEVGTRQPIVLPTPPSREACESKCKNVMSFEAVEDVPSDEVPMLPRYGASESDLGAPSDEMGSEKSACGSRSPSRTDSSYCSEENESEDNLDVLEAKRNEMEVLLTAAINRFGSSSKVFAESHLSKRPWRPRNSILGQASTRAIAAK